MNPLSQAPGPVITIEGIVIDVIVHREPKAPPEEGVPEFLEHGAMIDTGASDTCIDYRIAHALKLRQIDQRTIGTVGAPEQREALKPSSYPGTPPLNISCPHAHARALTFPSPAWAGEGGREAAG